MSKIKCVCGYEKCTTTIEVEGSIRTANIVIEHTNSPTNNRLDIGLDANGIVKLIIKLREALLDITNSI